MYQEYSTKIITAQRILLMIVILLVPFTHFSVDFPLVGGVPYELFLCMAYILLTYEIFIQKRELNQEEKIGLVFLLIYTMWAVITGIIGISEYPYFEYINLTQMENFKNFYDNVADIFSIGEISAIKTWLSYKEVRLAILNTLYTYCISFLVYHIYKDQWKKAFHDFRNILLILCSFLAIYSLFEIDYLWGGTAGKVILESINPIYMKIADTHGWWPPLFWNGQLRSMFPEPSYLGIFSSMSIPVLISCFYDKTLKRNSYLGIVLYCVLEMMLVLSKARTGIILFIGEFLLVIIWQIVCYRAHWQRFLAVVLCTAMMFIVGLGILSQFKYVQFFDTQNVTVESYMEENVNSVVGNQRSNNARRANVESNLRTGIANPLFGVGIGLKDMYVYQNLSYEDKNVPEVTERWIKNMYIKGPLKSGFPVLNQLTNVFAEQGIVGIFLFILPIIVGIVQFFKKKWLIKDPKAISIMIALCGLCVAFLSNRAMIYFYLIVGYMFVIIKYSRSEDNV